LLQLGEKLGEVGRSCSQLRAEPLRISPADERAQSLYPGPEGGRSPCFPGAAHKRLRSSQRGTVCELVDEAALADPGLARDQKQPSPPRERALETGEELGELALAPDEDSRCPSAEQRAAPAQCDGGL